MNRRTATICIVVIGLFALAGCAPQVVTTPVALGTGQPIVGTLNVGGSTALQPLVERAARNFEAAHPGVKINVSNTGSGAGRSGACQGKLDIGMSDVPLTAAERSSLDCADAVQTAVAMQAFVVAANTSGPGKLTALDREQMEAIFSGAVKNWSEIGGAPQQLVVINRLRGSGTRQSMADYLFDGNDTLFRSDAAEQESNDEVASTVGRTPGAISYLGLAYVNDPGLVILGIQRPNGLVLPTRDVVGGLHWPIGGPGLAITKGQPRALAAAFLSYMIGPEFRADPFWDSLGYVLPAKPAIGSQTGQ
jgi:phosphate transport system substrate-binding protein